MGTLLQYRALFFASATGSCCDRYCEEEGEKREGLHFWRWIGAGIEIEIREVGNSKVKYHV